MGCGASTDAPKIVVDGADPTVYKPLGSTDADKPPELTPSSPAPRTMGTASPTLRGSPVEVIEQMQGAIEDLRAQLDRAKRAHSAGSPVVLQL